MDGLQYSGSKRFEGKEGSVTWSSPSNIALTKYWGKHGQQLPRNPSISFTLSKACSTTTVSFLDTGNDPTFQFLFEGERQEKFESRIRDFLKRHADQFPYIPELSWKIESSNSFPHSSGIASSASAMSALIMCFCDIERLYFNSNLSDTDNLRRASYLSRLASGSASRSVYPFLGQWGAHEQIEKSSDLFAIPMAEILHPSFENYHDDILIVSAEEKSVSSSAGHQLMENNLYAPVRFAQAAQNTQRLIEILKNGDFEEFITIVESEALTLHALMMSGHPSFMLMKPNTLKVIEEIRSFRTSSNIPICFTLDAGPNVHILYPHNFAEQCQSFIKSMLKPLAVDGRIIMDQIGPGPIKIQ